MKHRNWKLFSLVVVTMMLGALVASAALRPPLRPLPRPRQPRLPKQPRPWLRLPRARRAASPSNCCGGPNGRMSRR